MLAIRPTPDTDLSLFPIENLVCETSFRPHFDALRAHGHLMKAVSDDPFDTALVFLTRHRAENLANISNALSRIRVGGYLIVDGQKTDGIDSILRQVRNVMSIEGVLSKSHGKVIWLQRPSAIPDIMATWAAQMELATNTDGFLTAPGMFSSDGLDEGSLFLANYLDPKIKGRVADLGAGWGALSSILLQRAPNIGSIDLFEAERSALKAARQNIVDPRAEFHWADVANIPAPDTFYDLVVSNPPFHITRKAEPEIGITFIAAAARLLTPKGRFLMVANRQLPYEAELDRLFRNWKELGANTRFKVIEATRPKPAQR